MKKIGYLTLICAVLDIVAIELASRYYGDDIIFPGFILIFLAPAILYSIITIVIVGQTRLTDNRPVLTTFLLTPGVLFLLLHAFIILYLTITGVYNVITALLN